jgi:hypothetical protein
MVQFLEETILNRLAAASPDLETAMQIKAGHSPNLKSKGEWIHLSSKTI